MYDTLQHNKCVISSKLIIVSVAKHFRGDKRGAWICPPAWKFDSTGSLIRVDYESPPQSPQAALRVAESVPTVKIFKKKSKFSKHFPLFEQISKKSFEVM